MTNWMKRYKYILLFLALLFIPMGVNSYTQYIVNLVLIYVLLPLGLTSFWGMWAGFHLPMPLFSNWGLCGRTFDGEMEYAVLDQPAHGQPYYCIDWHPDRISRAKAPSVLPGDCNIAFMSLMQFICIHGERHMDPAARYTSPVFMGFKFSGDKSVYYIILIISFLFLFYSQDS
jgi:hypothetical protein